MKAKETGIRINNKKVYVMDGEYVIEEDYQYLRQPLKTELRKIHKKIEEKEKEE